MVARIILIFILHCHGIHQLRAGEVNVAVASNFAGPMKQLAAVFEQETANRVLISYGSSGKFVAQIKHGAPFHVFLSADQAKPARLVEEGLALGETRFTYAVGSLVLWSPEADMIDERATRLHRGDFTRIALANPKLAPYGAAAVDVLQNLGLERATRARWVMGENIAQTFQFVSSGNASLGFVALSQITDQRRRGQGSLWIIPPELYQPIRQDAVLLQRGAHNQVAVAFMTFLAGEVAGRIIEAHGYGIRSVSHFEGER